MSTAVRRGLRNLAITMRGNEGVQLDLTGGESLLIGSQSAAELSKAITLAKSESE